MRLALALALSLAVIPTADARPRKQAKRVIIDERPDDDTLGAAPLAGTTKRKARRIEEARDDDADEDDTDVAAREDETDEVEEVAVVRRAPSKLRDWHLALGPYLWASAVEADVSLGSQSVSAGVDFMDISRHARYGIELQGEARYKRFSFAADVMYGVVDLEGNGDVGPLMVSVAGTASSLLVDGAAGVTLLGDEHSLFAIEARAGARYQRTSLSASVGVSGSPVASPASVDAAGDAIAGGRVFVRPLRRVSVTGAFDMHAFGVSRDTWSASADASVRVTDRVMVSLGWRTLTMERATLKMTMYGPRLALQLLF